MKNLLKFIIIFFNCSILFACPFQMQLDSVQKREELFVKQNTLSGSPCFFLKVESPEDYKVNWIKVYEKNDPVWYVSFESKLQYPLYPINFINESKCVEYGQAVENVKPSILTPLKLNTIYSASVFLESLKNKQPIEFVTKFEMQNKDGITVLDIIK